MKLTDLLKDSAYKWTQFKPAQIAVIEDGINGAEAMDSHRWHGLPGA